MLLPNQASSLLDGLPTASVHPHQSHRLHPSALMHIEATIRRRVVLRGCCPSSTHVPSTILPSIGSSAQCRADVKPVSHVLLIRPHTHAKDQLHCRVLVETMSTGNHITNELYLIKALLLLLLCQQKHGSAGTPMERGSPPTTLGGYPCILKQLQTPSTAQTTRLICPNVHSPC